MQAAEERVPGKQSQKTSYGIYCQYMGPDLSQMPKGRMMTVQEWEAINRGDHWAPKLFATKKEAEDFLTSDVCRKMVPFYTGETQFIPVEIGSGLELWQFCVKPVDPNDICAGDIDAYPYRAKGYVHHHVTRVSPPAHFYHVYVPWKRTKYCNTLRMPDVCDEHDEHDEHDKNEAEEIENLD